jgi:hypothetical protein
MFQTSPGEHGRLCAGISRSVAQGPWMRNRQPIPKRIRLNVVSPAPVVEPEQVKEGVVSAAQVAEFYVESIAGQATGTVFRAWGGLTG